MEPTLRAIAESGETFEDPSEDLLFELLLDIERGDNQFLIVERTADTSGQTYAQVILHEDGGWLVERRDGGPEAHFAAVLPNLRETHRLLTAWGFETPAWENMASWERISVGDA